MAETTRAEALKLIIRNWQERSTHNSLSRLSRKSKLSGSTVNRLGNGHAGEPTLDSVLAILEVAATQDQTSEFLQTHYPKFYPTYKRNLETKAPVDPEQKKFNFDPIYKLLSDPITFMLMQRILAKPGIQREEVSRLYGAAGIDVCLGLMDGGLIVRQEDGSWKCPYDDLSAALCVNKDRVISSAKAFNPKSSEAGCGILHTLSEGVTIEAAREITKVMQEAIAKTREIRDANPGGHVFVANYVMQLADPESALDKGAN